MHNASGTTLSTGCAAATAVRSRRPWPRVGRRSRGGRPAWFPEEVPGDEARDAVRTELDFDPVPVFARVRVPTLLVYGDEDEWIPVHESLAAWREARGDEIDIVIVLGTGRRDPRTARTSRPSTKSRSRPRLRATTGLCARRARPTRVELRLAVGVRLVVQVLAPDRAEAGAVGAAEDLVRQLQREARRAPRRRGRACRPRRTVSAARRPQGRSRGISAPRSAGREPRPRGTGSRGRGAGRGRRLEDGARRRARDRQPAGTFSGTGS